MADKKAKKIDPKDFIIDQSYENPLEEMSDLPITATKKIKKNVYFRVKDGKDYDPLALITLSDPRSIEEQAFMVLPTIVNQLTDLADQITTSRCYLIITRAGEKKILHVPAISDVNKGNTLLVNRAKILEEAKTKWLRMTWDDDVRLHRAVYPKFEIPEPEWGELPPLHEIIYQAFEGRVIESPDHELVEYLLGGK